MTFGKKFLALKKKTDPKAAQDATAVSKKISSVMMEKKEPLPNPDLSAVTAAAGKIGQKNKAKLKRMSQQITRGTPAANPNPFIKR